MQWSSKSLGSKLQHEFFYLLIRLKLLRIARFILRIVVLYYVLLPNVRQRALPYLQRRFPKASKLAYLKHAYRLFFHFAEVLFERALGGITDTLLVESVPTYEDAFFSALSENKGCIVLSAHVGAWQMALAGLEKAARPIHIVQFRTGDVDKHYFEHGHKHAISLIEAGDALACSLAIAQALQRREIVCLMGDRVMDGTASATVTFLQGKIRVPLTAYQMAAVSQAPLFMTFSVLKEGKITPVYGEVVHVPQKAKHNVHMLQDYAEKFIQLLTMMVERYPYSFFNFYDLWACDDSRRT